MVTFLSGVVSNLAMAGFLAVLATVLTTSWRSPHLAHALWLLVLIKSVTPPIISMPVDRFSSRDRTRSERDEPAEPASFYSPSPNGLSSSPGSPVMPPASGNGDSSSRELNMGTGDTPGVAWPQCLLGAWMVGTMIFVSTYVRRHRQVLGLIAGSLAPDPALAQDAMQLAQHIGLAACPSLRVTNRLVCPFVTPGVQTPTVVLPRQLLAELNRDQVRSILAHELIHVRRRDHWVRVFAVCVSSLNWWNPIVWWANRQLRQAEEECCDAWVVWALPGIRRTYGRTLLAVAEHLTRADGLPAVTGTPFGGSFLKRRINVILNHTVRHRISRPALATILGVSSIILPVGLSQALPEDEPAQKAITSSQDMASKIVTDWTMQKEKVDNISCEVNGSLTFMRGSQTWIVQVDFPGQQIPEVPSENHSSRYRVGYVLDLKNQRARRDTNRALLFSNRSEQFSGYKFRAIDEVDVLDGRVGQTYRARERNDSTANTLPPMFVDLTVHNESSRHSSWQSFFLATDYPLLLALAVLPQMELQSDEKAEPQSLASHFKVVGTEAIAGRGHLILEAALKPTGQVLRYWVDLDRDSCISRYSVRCGGQERMRIDMDHKCHHRLWLPTHARLLRLGDQGAINEVYELDFSYTGINAELQDGQFHFREEPGMVVAADQTVYRIGDDGQRTVIEEQPR